MPETLSRNGCPELRPFAAARRLYANPTKRAATLRMFVIAYAAEAPKAEPAARLSNQCTAPAMLSAQVGWRE